MSFTPFTHLHASVLLPDCMSSAPSPSGRRVSVCINKHEYIKRSSSRLLRLVSVSETKGKNEANTFSLPPTLKWNYTTHHYIRRLWLLSHIYMLAFAAFPSIHPSPIILHISFQGCWSLSQMSQGESGVTQWTSQQFIAASQRDKQPFACRNVGHNANIH